MKTRAMFRRFPEGDILAIFPDIDERPHDPGLFCLSYANCGQHGSADVALCLQHTEAATKDERADLEKELREIGYELEIIEES
jgi:hypothetical protein